MSTYSNLKIEEITLGDAGWGTSTTNNLLAIQQALQTATLVTGDFVGNATTLPWTNSSSTLNTPRAMCLNVTATLSGAGTVNLPAITGGKVYLAINNSVGGYAVTFKVTGLTGISVPNGKAMWLYNNGTDIVDGLNYISTLSLGTDLAIADGGTGASTASGARTNLGATTLGGNLFTIANPSAVTFPQFNADNTVSSLDAASFRAAIGAGTGGGTVTGVTGTSPVTSSGGTAPAIGLASAYGDTQNPYASKTANNFLAAPNGSAGAPTFRAIVAADIPTLNQNTTGQAGYVANSLSAGTGLTGGPFNGFSAATFAIDSTVATLTGVQTLTNKTISGASNTLSNIGNGSLTNSAITINGNAVSLGGSTTVTAVSPNALTIGTGLTGSSYNGSSAVTVAIDSTVATLTGSQTLTNKTISGASNTLSNIGNSSLTNSSITFGSTAAALGTTVNSFSLTGNITGANFYPSSTSGIFGYADLSAAITTGNGSASPANAVLTYTAGSERARFDASGQLLMGVVSPRAGSRYMRIDNSDTGSTSQSQLWLSSDASGGSVTFNAHAAAFGSGYGGFSGINNSGNGNGLYISDSSSGSKITFQIGGGSQSASEKARFDSSGNFLVGDTNSYGKVYIKGVGGSAPPISLYISSSASGSTDYAIFASNAGSQSLFTVRTDGAFNTGAATNSPVNLTTANAANVYIGGSSGTLYKSTSSRKYKRDIENAWYGLSDALKLRPVTYKQKTADAEGNIPDTVFGGLIAEEVHEAGLPEFVVYGEDGTPDALAYGPMVSLCLKAIQELKAEFDAYKASHP